MLSALLALAYVFARKRNRRHHGARLPATRPQRQRPRFSRAPQRPAQKPHAHHDTRPQRERVIDLHQRGGIFLVTDAAQIDGYTHIELGEVRVDGGAGFEARLKRAAAQRFGQANALVRVHEVRQMQRYLAGAGRDGAPTFKTREMHEWRAMAVQAAPMLPDMMPPGTYREDLVLIDGSNVMNWEVDAGTADAPSLRPLTQVLATLKACGIAAGVVFDANAGHRLEGRFMNHDDLAARLPTAADVLVVDRGTQADPVLIDIARAEGLIIISNDHFRDAPSARHLLKQKGFMAGDGVTLLEPRA
jgi:hypothetical protein